jgi:hypothetical protein
MSDPVPVAGNLLESKFLGVSIRRLGESMAIPIAPCLVGYTLGIPLVITFPLFVVGIGIGVLIYAKTPPGQRPLRYAHAVVRHRTSSTVYVWAPSSTLEDTLATGTRQDDWLTQPPSVRASIRDSQAGVSTDGGGSDRTPTPALRPIGRDEEGP